jgi:hypothetical protein
MADVVVPRLNEPAIAWSGPTVTDWSEPGVRYQTADRVATITLDRPEHKNAVTPAMNEALFAAFRRAEADEEVRAILLTGEGDAFCAGADVKWFIEERLEGLLALPMDERVAHAVSAMGAGDPTRREATTIPPTCGCCSTCAPRSWWP